MELKYIVYFLIGGTVVSSVTYLAGQAKGLLAAFIANLPLTTLLTFLMIYSETGDREVVSYAKGLTIMLIPWLAYIVAVIFLTPKVRVIPALMIGLFLYLLFAFIIISFKK